MLMPMGEGDRTQEGLIRGNACVLSMTDSLEAESGTSQRNTLYQGLSTGGTRTPAGT